jgi:hypothetical protein
MKSSTVALFMVLLYYEDLSAYEVSVVERRLKGPECLCWLLVVLLGIALFCRC